jgi:mono/diheme cytochrome c family protein
MRRQTIIFLFFVLTLTISLTSYAGGESTYKSVCIACHASGMNGAPKFQNNRDWASIIKEGKVHVIAEAYNGVRKMPAKGGKPDLALEDFSEALIYMVNASGGNWSKPTEQEYIQIRNNISKLNSKRKPS